jgi:hypothetical protein
MEIFPTGDVYIGIKGAGDANTNEILRNALTDANLSTEHEGKIYKDKWIEVWKVTTNFIKMFYRKQQNFDLMFDIYIENNYIMQLYPLLKPALQKKAKNERRKAVRKLKELKKVRKNSFQGNPN